jgi:hypothetical protein
MSTALNDPTADLKGQRFHCKTCGSEIEIINPSPAHPPTHSFRCCGAEMAPTVGRDINLGVE